MWYIWLSLLHQISVGSAESQTGSNQVFCLHVTFMLYTAIFEVVHVDEVSPIRGTSLHCHSFGQLNCWRPIYGVEFM